jgi:hypothetical protein
MPVFSLLVDGDLRLGLPNYSFLRARLNELLCNLLPRVRLLSGGGSGLDILVERWAEEHGLPVQRFPPRRDYRNAAELMQWAMNNNPDGLVVFDAGRNESAELVKRVRAKGMALRVIDVRTLFPR